MGPSSLRWACLFCMRAAVGMHRNNTSIEQQCLALWGILSWSISYMSSLHKAVDSLSGAAQVNARMGGGPVYAMNNFVWGIDMVEEQFLASCGIPSRPYMSKQPVKCIAEFSVNAQKTGKLLNVDWADVRLP